jgi:hypothetical protein
MMFIMIADSELIPALLQYWVQGISYLKMGAAYQDMELTVFLYD